MRRKYWSISKFSDFIRGNKKPEVGTIQEWADWRKKSEKEHPIRYWIAEEGLDMLQNFFCWPVDKIYAAKYYIVNRFVSHSNALVAHREHIKPGQYADLDTRILFCLFDELSNYVEVEAANLNFQFDSEKKKTLRWWQVGKWRTRTWRNPEAGVDYLKWEISLIDEETGVPTSQSAGAQEILHLYTWWKEIYPNRPEVYDASGYNDYCADREKRGIELFGDDPGYDVLDILKKSSEIEDKYREEDTEMLCRLIRVRGNLWT
jgi:hypothetical protein